MKGAIKNNGSNAEQSDGIAEAFSGLTICLKPEDDLPHPRHLCFRYPFSKTSPKRYCSKCYCYVCEEIAPCKKWNKAPRKHCQATEKEEHWTLQKQLMKKAPPTICKMARHKLCITVVFQPAGQFVKAFSGGLISKSNGEWISGFSMRIRNNISPDDSSFTLYTALLEGLKLSWAQGFRYLDVNLGYLFHDLFWFDFTKDDGTKKYHLSITPYCVSSPQIWSIMKEVDDYLNREWFIDVGKCGSFKEETGSFTLAVMADSPAEAKKKVFDFTTCPGTARLMNAACTIESRVSQYYALSALLTARNFLDGLRDDFSRSSEFI